MPGRGHKVASRQAQLGQRRRKQNRTASPVASRPRTAMPESAPSRGAPSEGGAQPDQPTVATAPVRAETGHTQRGQAQYHPLVLDHIGSELRRIGVVGTVAVAVLLVLSIVVL